MKDRAARRRHRERMKRRAAALYGPAFAGRLADNRTPCSCRMCGNPRRYTGERTVQERRHAQPET